MRVMHAFHRSAALVATAIGLLFSGGCASTPVKTLPAIPLEQRAREVRIFDGEGRGVPWEAVVSASEKADAVVIGENHGHELGLAFASALWADVLARRSDAVLSLEFFNRDEQSRVDDYLAGLWTEEAFITATNRARPGAYPPAHRAMVVAAKEKGRPVIASNAPRVYVRAAGKESFERLSGLSPEQRRMFRIPDSLPEGKYRADFEALMSDPSMASHGAPAKEESPEEVRARVEAAFRSQSLWDWTMAESIVRGLELGRPVVHIVGRFHSDFDGGLVEALRKLRPGTNAVTISTVDAWSDALRDEDRGRGGFVVYIGPGEER